jgi:hypothetical protein
MDRVPAPATASVPTPFATRGAMNTTDVVGQLRDLAEPHPAGALSDEGFAQAKWQVNRSRSA